jgi:hypothetical protein
MSERAARQSFLGANSEAVLSGASVAVVGNCGGGSHVAQQLAHVGIGRFVLIDPDVTEEVNLNRMIGSRPADAKAARPKTAVLRRLIRSINPRAAVEPLKHRWQECAEVLRECDLVFGCVDGYANRGELEAYCRRFLLPYIDVGMDVAETNGQYIISGQIITSIPGRACMRCLGFLTDEVMEREAARYGQAGPRPQVVWPNGVLASVAVGIGMQLLLPWSGEHVWAHLNYDGNRQLLSPSNRLPHLDVSKCPHYPIHQVGDPLWGSSAAAR